jgi:hypothetical protein
MTMFSHSSQPRSIVKRLFPFFHKILHELQTRAQNVVFWMPPTGGETTPVTSRCWKMRRPVHFGPFHIVCCGGFSRRRATGDVLKDAWFQTASLARMYLCRQQALARGFLEAATDFCLRARSPESGRVRYSIQRRVALGRHLQEGYQIK